MRPFIKQIHTNITKVGTSLVPPKKSPDELLGELFQDVQLKNVHADGKTFVDSIAVSKRRKILKDYQKARLQPGFDLSKFVAHHFRDFVEAANSYQSNPSLSPEDHIRELWPVLTRQALTNKGSILALPHSYVVPGGRFQEQFYWDTYFVMLGLAASDRWDMVGNIMKNFTYMVRKIGYIPTANRTYFLSRSQPPFFALMVRLMAQKKGNRALVQYLPYMLKEHQFWMAGRLRLNGFHQSHRRVVLLSDGSVLNRYYDDKRTPRPESYREDIETARLAHAEPSQVYLDLRAGAESGWDFSSRWLADGVHLETIHTTDIVPIDLNCLMVILEETIADAYDILKQPLLANSFRKKAIKRTAAIRRYCWNEAEGFFCDYDFIAREQTPVLSLAGVFPLFAGIAYPAEADAVAKRLEKDFLQIGGLTTTLKDTGQQWDAPNGWAPLQWISIEGLRRYNHGDLAYEIKKRWADLNVGIYKKSGKMVEKYNVVNPEGGGGGGEYPLQDGFGWTNGVLMKLLTETE